MTAAALESLAARVERDGPSRELDRLALILWREREMTFPPRCRRMTPDAFDMIEAWPRMLAETRTAMEKEKADG